MAQKAGAVSLAYLGGLVEHAELAVPLLDTLGLRASFYLSDRVVERATAWRSIGGRHELGCHPLFDVTPPDGSLPNWSLQAVTDEFRASGKLLRESTGTPPPVGVFLPGHSRVCAEGDYSPVVRDIFSHSLTADFGFNSVSGADPFALKTIETVDQTSDELIDSASKAFRDGEWAIFAFHGIGAGEPSCDAKAHDGLLFFLSERANSLIAPVGEVMRLAAITA